MKYLTLNELNQAKQNNQIEIDSFESDLIDVENQLALIEVRCQYGIYDMPYNEQKRVIELRKKRDSIKNKLSHLYNTRNILASYTMVK